MRALLISLVIGLTVSLVWGQAPSELSATDHSIHWSQRTVMIFIAKYVYVASYSELSNCLQNQWQKYST